MTRKIVQLILEARGNQGLSIFDIDETLFYSKAKVKVVKDGKVIKTLDNVQFNNYKLGNGEDFDFGEFKSAKIFNQTSTPIGRMIAKAKAIIRNAVAKGSKVIFVTARGDLDDKKLFISTFKAQGLDMKNVYVERAGNLGPNKPEKNKRIVFKKYLDTGNYKRIRLFDDHVENLYALLLIESMLPG